MASASLRAERNPDPAPGPVRAPAEAVRAPRRPDDRLPVALLLAAPVGITIWGWRYYTLAPAERLRHPLNALLRPSGPIGLALGIVGFALFLFMWAYVMRKQARWLAWTGAVGSWLRVHIVIGLALPVIVAVHAGWRFDGLIGLGYMAMFVVALSGVVGRYLYARLPRQRNGVEMTLEEVGQERRALLTRIAVTTGLEPQAVERALAVDPEPYVGLGLVRALIRMTQDDWARARRVRTLRQEWSRPRAGKPAPDRRSLDEILRLAQREIALQQEVRAIEATRRIFGYWHVFHRPFAATALIAVVVHVLVAVFVGGVGVGQP